MKSMPNLSHPKYQVFLMLISLAFIYVFVNESTYLFNTTDSLPKVSNYIGIKNDIETGFYLKNFLKFDIKENEFALDGIIWFKVPLGFEYEKLLEDFSVGKAKILFKSNPIVQEYDKFKIFSYLVKLEFESNLNFKNYPLSDHVVSFTISNPLLAEKGIYLKTKKDFFTTSVNLFVDGWSLFSKKNSFGFDSFHISDFVFNNSRVVYSLDFKRSSKRSFFLILFPLLVALFLSFIAFSIDIERISSIISISTASLSSIIGYRFVIESMSPKVSYFMFSDIFFILILFFSSISFFINVFMREKINNYTDYLVFILYSSFIASWKLILWIWF